MIKKPITDVEMEHIRKRFDSRLMAPNRSDGMRLWSEVVRLTQEKDAAFSAALEAACRVMCWACASHQRGDLYFQAGPAYIEAVEGGGWVHDFMEGGELRITDCFAAQIRALMAKPPAPTGAG